MKKSLKLLSGSVLAAAMISPAAQAEVTANVAIQSDYVWRGISQNLEDPSIQGGFDYASETGFYAGVWGASVDFGGVESTEMDLYAGWGTEFENGVGLDLGLIEYTYHGGSGASDSNFTEAYIGVSYAGFGAYFYAGDEFDDLIEISYGYDFESGFSLAAAYGDYDSYSYYTAGVSTEIEGIGLDLSYWDTDISLGDVGGDEEAFSVVDGRVVFTISKSF